MNKKKLVKNLIVLIFFICIVNFLANKLYWYSSIWYFDMIMHALGGFWLGLAALYVFPPKDGQVSISVIVKILISVLCIGVAWELYEVIVNGALAQDVFSSLDTISDICFDLTGGAFAIFYFLKRIVFTGEDKVQLS